MTFATRPVIFPALRLAGAFILCFFAAHEAAAQVPPEYQGDWVAAAGTCEAPARVRIEAAKLTLMNGADAESFGGIEMAGPGYFAPDYRGIMAVLITEFSGDQPVLATFNIQEKRGLAQVDLSTPSPVRAPNPALAALNAHYAKLNLRSRFPLNTVPLKKCPRGAAAPVSPRGAPVSGAAQPRPQTAQAPALCPGQRYCDEVPAFAAVVTDFRPSLYDQTTRIVSATVRFQNKLARPLILGYVATAAVAIDEQGNRYTLASASGVRGIAPIAGGEFDPKFTVQPGQAADTRFELAWRWNGRDIIGQRAWDMELTVREVNEVAPGQYRFGAEHVLQFKGLSNAGATSAAPAGGGLSRVPVGATAAGIPAPSPSAAVPAPAQVPPTEPDVCQGRVGCYDAGPFVAEILNATGTQQTLARPWHSLSLNVRIRNKSAEPIILGYVVGTGVIIDNLGNRYGAATAPGDVKGMGRVQARAADPQFVLRPGEARSVTFVQSRVMRGTPNAAIIGTSYTYDLSLAQLEVLYNGQQVRTIREHSLTFPNFTTGTAGSAAAAPAGTAPSPEDLKKTGGAILDLFKGRGRK